VASPSFFHTSSCSVTKSDNLVLAV
jgi:adiponectin receptor